VEYIPAATGPRPICDVDLGLTVRE
jgi:hypothetical protein